MYFHKVLTMNLTYNFLNLIINTFTFLILIFDKNKLLKINFFYQKYFFKIKCI